LHQDCIGLASGLHRVGIKGRRRRTHHTVEPLLLQLWLRLGWGEVVGRVPHAQLLHGAVGRSLGVEVLEDVRQEIMRDLAVRLGLDCDEVLLGDVPDAINGGAAR
jgi:hypothetical protein